MVGATLTHPPTPTHPCPTLAGFVVLEAMASGVPVVAVRAGGIPDILTKQGVTGYLFEPGVRCGVGCGWAEGGQDGVVGGWLDGRR